MTVTCHHCGLTWDEIRSWEEGTDEERERLIVHKAQACGCSQCVKAAGGKRDRGKYDWKAMGLIPPDEDKTDDDIDWDDPDPLEKA